MHCIFQELICDLLNMNTQLFCGFVCLFWKTCYILLSSTLALTGRKKIYQQRREGTQSLQYLPNIPRTLLYFPQMTYSHFCCIHCTGRFSFFFDSTEGRTQCIDTVPMTLETAWSCISLGQWQSSHWPGQEKTGPVQSSHDSNTKLAMHCYQENITHSLFQRYE